MTDHEARAREIVAQCIDALSKAFNDEQPELGYMSHDHMLGAYCEAIDNQFSAISQALREAEEAEREACAKIADRWGEGRMVVQDEPGRSRYSRHDLQTYTNVAGRGIAEDIRSRGEKDNDH